jgi:hypothetical protein
MTYRGHIENGIVVLEDASDLPEGAKVVVMCVDSSQDNAVEDETGPTLYERLEPVIGAAKGLPLDASRNVDHYLYGAPRT